MSRHRRPSMIHRRATGVGVGMFSNALWTTALAISVIEDGFTAGAWGCLAMLTVSLVFTYMAWFGDRYRQ